MYCKNCGKELENNQEVCTFCGVTCGNGLKYCADCGTKLEDGKCPKCSAPKKEAKPVAPAEKKPAPAKKPVSEPKKPAEQPKAPAPAAKEEPKGLDKLLSLFRKK